MSEFQERATVKCSLCSYPTFNLGTRMCDRCWELNRRIRHDPDLAKKILKRMRDERKCNETGPIGKS